MRLADAPIIPAGWFPAPDMAGRQLRVFHRLTSVRVLGEAGFSLCPSLNAAVAVEIPLDATQAEALAMVAADPACYAVLNELRLHARGMYAPLRRYTHPSELSDVDGDNATLIDTLQDLADEIAEDVTEALAAFDDPDCWYAGVDRGIEPVPDSHVMLVIAAMQRELNREKRDRSGVNKEPRLPPAPLAMLPWRVQRALAERRRLRYAQYGITRTSWLAGTWSLWNVADDPDWLPRRRTS